MQAQDAATQKSAATNGRNFRTFLLVSQLEAKAIGARIARARDEAGLTQEQVADLATFSKRSLQDYETGVTIPYKHMQEISRLLDREVPWFLHGELERVTDAASLAEIVRRLESLEAKVDLQGLATVASVDAVARDLRALTRKLPRVDVRATGTG